MLQKPHRKSKDSEHRVALESRLTHWSNGDFMELLQEGNAIQSYLNKYHKKQNKEAPTTLPRDFANQMFQGKTKAALNMLSGDGKSGILNLNEHITVGDKTTTVRQILKDKHPPAQGADQSLVILQHDFNTNIHPVVFERIDSSLVRRSALNCKGAAGPSGLDAYAWRRLCTSFGKTSDNLCHSLALMAKRLCVDLVDPKLLMPFLTCRLIALNKNPGVRPIGIGDTSRRIIAKAILSIIRPNIQEVAGLYQLCAGQCAGVESAAHAARKLFESEENEAILLVDATNAFNSINRYSALHNIRTQCPTFATVLINCYRTQSDLFFDNETIYSQEGTTQGDPLAMPFYALATVPLIKMLPKLVKHIWYADDATAIGSLNHLQKWWDTLVELGHKFGYFVNPSKSWIVTKEGNLENATSIFQNSNINVTNEGRPYLGIPIGTQQYVDQFVQSKVDQWVGEIDRLSTIACSQPQAAYAALTHGLSSQWLYFLRTIPNISHHMEHLEMSIRSQLIPAIANRSPINDNERDLFALPVRLGGMGIRNPVTQAPDELSASIRICSPIVNKLLAGDFDHDYDCECKQINTKADIRRDQQAREKERTNDLVQNLPPPKQRAIQLASEKGASIWLTSLPLDEFGLSLHKRAFTDAIALRYGWAPPNTPTHCACGISFSVEHSLSCPKGGFPTIRHNQLRNMTASLLTEVCHDVEIEPHLQPASRVECPNPKTNISDGARLDISMNGFWGGQYEKTFLDVRVFNSYANSYKNIEIEKCYKRHETEKKKMYEERILNVEHSTFTPLIFSVTGGMSRECTLFFKRLASMLAEKREQSMECYSFQK